MPQQWGLIFTCSTTRSQHTNFTTSPPTIFEAPPFNNGHGLLHPLLKEPFFPMLDVVVIFFLASLINSENWSFWFSLLLLLVLPQLASWSGGAGAVLLCTRSMLDLDMVMVLSLYLVRWMKLVKVSSLSITGAFHCCWSEWTTPPMYSSPLNAVLLVPFVVEGTFPCLGTWCCGGSVEAITLFAVWPCTFEEFDDDDDDEFLLPIWILCKVGIWFGLVWIAVLFVRWRIWISDGKFRFLVGSVWCRVYKAQKIMGYLSASYKRCTSLFYSVSSRV